MNFLFSLIDHHLNFIIKLLIGLYLRFINFHFFIFQVIFLFSLFLHLIKFIILKLLIIYYRQFIHYKYFLFKFLILMPNLIKIIIKLLSIIIIIIYFSYFLINLSLKH